VGSDLDVPDPYYGGDRDFDYVVDLAEAAAPGIVAEVRRALSTRGRGERQATRHSSRVPDIAITTYLAETAAQETEVHAWLTELPATVARLADEWDLALGAPYEPGGYCSWVAPARRASGEHVVLKVGWRHPEAAREADALQFWAGEGAVRLHDHRELDHTSVLLLERCDPGTRLRQLVAEPEQDLVVAGLLRRLWRQPPADHSFDDLADRCVEWADDFDEKYAASPTGIDVGHVRTAGSIFRELPQSATDRRLLCIDLHADNILAAQREPWLVIDPKPHVGDVTFDPVQHMLNCEERLRADPAGLTQRMAALLDLDAGRVSLWLYARCVQESPDQPWLYDVAKRVAP
jgi:streptomycin 6-kinase